MTSPTEKELSNIELALQKLWDLDENKLNPGVDVCNKTNKMSHFKSVKS